MKKSIKTLALFAVLSLAATGCQKENDVYPMDASEQTTGTIKVIYSINGEVYRATMSESEWDAFMERMLALAREGYEVTFSKNVDSLSAQSKEKVVFTTNSENEANAWANDMVDQGYAVTITYNKKTGLYTCIAIK